MPERLGSCCSGPGRVFSPKAVRVTAKEQGAGPEEKTDGERRVGDLDR